MRPEEITEEVTLIRLYQGWPLWPWLPMKKRKGDGSWPDLGVIHASSAGDRGFDHPPDPNPKPRVYTVPYPTLAEIGVGNAPYVDYDSVEDMVNDGWVGD